jgi:hypothetical protein
VSLEIHAIPTRTLGEYASSYATVKNWVAQFKRGEFSTFFFLVDLRTYQHSGNNTLLIGSIILQDLFLELHHLQFLD